MKKALTFASAALVLAGLTTVGAANASHHKGDHGDKPHHGKGMIKQMDSNGDGIVSKEESLAFVEMLYSTADTDGDGNLTIDEMRAHHKAEMRKKHCNDE